MYSLNVFTISISINLIKSAAHTIYPTFAVNTTLTDYISYLQRRLRTYVYTNLGFCGQSACPCLTLLFLIKEEELHFPLCMQDRILFLKPESVASMHSKLLVTEMTIIYYAII